MRNYECLGFIPPAERGPQGYRLYTQQHLHAMRVARVVIAGFGWENARMIMQLVHQGALSAALAVIDARHAEIHRSRCEIEETLKILRTTSATLPDLAKAQHQGSPHHGLRVGEAAQSVGMRVSALRFWEEQGLVHPQRDRISGYRLYDAEQMRNLQIVALLRKADYGFDAIRTVLAQLAAGTPEQALMAAENRLKELAEVSRRCIEAAVALWTYLEIRSPALSTREQAAYTDQ